VVVLGAAVGASSTLVYLYLSAELLVVMALHMCAFASSQITSILSPTISLLGLHTDIGMELDPVPSRMRLCDTMTCFSHLSKETYESKAFRDTFFLVATIRNSLEKGG
jgi:hypothetical protein